jgi:hypothetical protein
MVTASINKVKEERKNEKSNSLPKENWTGFAYLTLISFILVLVFGILGSNFIYMTNLKQDILDKILPSKESDYFAEEALKSGGGLYNGEESKYENKEHKEYKKVKFSSMSILPSKGWPYSMKVKSHFSESFLTKIKNWFASTCAESFITSRDLLKVWLNLFNNEGFLGNDTLQILLAPFNLWLGIVIAFFVGLGSTTLALYNASGLLFFILGFFLLYNFVFIHTLSIIHSILFLLTFLVLPLILDFKKVMYIFHSNISLLTTMLGIFTCIAALFSFDLTTSSIFIVSFILITVMSYFTSF